MDRKILIGVVCLCMASSSITLAQNYYEEYDSAPQQPQQHRPAPARLSPSNGPVTEKPAPVAILKQINRHNEDGSYTYGFEGADGSFKIETKAQTGEVKGKYGYVDETGKVRVVEYGADKFGFQPSGEGITVAPPTLVDETRFKDEPEYQEEEQRQPQRSYVARINTQPQPQRPRPAPQRIPQQQPQYEEYQQQQPPQHTTYDLRPQQPQPPRRQQLIQASPVPPRPVQVPGAVPSDVTYSAQNRPPRPQEQPEYVQQRANFAPQQQQQQSFHGLSRGYETQEQQAPQQFAYAPAPAPQRPAAPAAPQQIQHPKNNYPQGRSSVLDQLAKDYALPANGAAALTDVSFGFY